MFLIMAKCRDFTYIDDVVNAIEGCCYKPAVVDAKFNFINPDSSKSFVHIWFLM